MSLFKTCQICFIWTTFGILIDSLVAVTYELINYCKMLVDDLRPERLASLDNFCILIEL